MSQSLILSFPFSPLSEISDGPHPRVCDSVGLAWVQESAFLMNCQVNVDATQPGAHFESH